MNSTPVKVITIVLSILAIMGMTFAMIVLAVDVFQQASVWTLPGVTQLLFYFVACVVVLLPTPVVILNLVDDLRRVRLRPLGLRIGVRIALLALAAVALGVGLAHGYVAYIVLTLGVIPLVVLWFRKPR